MSRKLTDAEEGLLEFNRQRTSVILNDQIARAAAAEDQRKRDDNARAEYAALQREIEAEEEFKRFRRGRNATKRLRRGR